MIDVYVIGIENGDVCTASIEDGCIICNKVVGSDYLG